MSISGIRARVSRGYGDSVVRRSFVLLCLMGPAFAINLLFYYVAAALLTPLDFGLLYVAVTAANVLYSGSAVLNIFFTRYLVAVIRAGGDAAAYPARSRIQDLVVRWGAPVALACILSLLVFGRWIGVESWPLIVLIVLDAYTAYLIDIDRALLQSLRRTVSLGTLTLIWMGLRFLLGVVGMALFKTAWGGMLGVVLATIVAIVVLSIVFAARRDAAPQPFPALPSVRALLPVVLGYATLILISNLDVLLTYLLLKNSTLGAYSASSVFPKGILVVITPFLQMLYPMMVAPQRTALDNSVVLQKSAGVIFALSGAMALVVFLFSGWLCGGAWGLKLCQPHPLETLLLSAVLLSILRALVFYQSARARDWTAISMLVPAAAYVWIAQVSLHSVETVAVQFTIFSAAVLFYYGALSFIVERRLAVGR